MSRTRGHRKPRIMRKCFCGSSRCWMLYGDEAMVRDMELKHRKRKDELRKPLKEKEDVHQRDEGEER